MSYVLKTNLSNPHNYGGYRDIATIEWLPIHYTANDGDSDEGNANYFHNNALPDPASANAFVDDDSVTISVPDNRIAYAVGGAKWGDCLQTGGGKLFGKCRNANSYSIEMCDTRRDGVHNVSPKTRANTLLYTARKMIEFNISPDHVIRHFDINGKHCPGIAGWYGPNPTEWYKFKEDLMAITGKEMLGMINAYLATQPYPDDKFKTMEHKLAKAKELGISDCANLMQLMPRWQGILMNLAVYEKVKGNE